MAALPTPPGTLAIPARETAPAGPVVPTTGQIWPRGNP